MSKISLEHFVNPWIGQIKLPASKSISNRLLILQALYPEIKIKHLSTAQDSTVLSQALLQKEKASKINVGHAGTAMRFLTAYFAVVPGAVVVLSGSERMHQRPIAILVDALKSLGAQISYLDQEGFPPLRITGKNIKGGKVVLNSSVSSQYITALLLIAPKLKNGLQLQMLGNVVSAPYIQLTLDLLKQNHFSFTQTKNQINVDGNQNLTKGLNFTVEPDWSAAAFWYAFVALKKNSRIILQNLSINSAQGDAKLAEAFLYLGVKTTSHKNGLEISNQGFCATAVHLNFNAMPDVAQAFVVAASALGVYTKVEGLSTLKIKETNRLLAIQTELKKVGVNVLVGPDSWTVKAQVMHAPTSAFKTYQDHRMAMALAPLCNLFEVEIEEPQVVLKSYPHFWEDLQALGLKIKA